jgi:hypothetical protein
MGLPFIYLLVEPDVDFYCKLDYDPFLMMQTQGIKYGFNIALKELMKTVPTLGGVTDDFMRTETERDAGERPLLSMFLEKPCGVLSLCLT